MAAGPKAGGTCFGRVTKKDAGVSVHPLSRRAVQPSIDAQTPVAAIADMPAKDQAAHILIIYGRMPDRHSLAAPCSAAARSRAAASRPISACLRALPQA